MEISVSIEPLLRGEEFELRKYLDGLVKLAGGVKIHGKRNVFGFITEKISVHFDYFQHMPEKLRIVGECSGKIDIHLHSMLPDFLSVLPELVRYNFTSISIHSENTQYLTDIMKTAKCGIVFDLPVCDIENFAKAIKKCDYVTVMTVNSGASGRPFDGAALGKIAKIRALNPKAKIIVDGGINDKTFNFVEAAGADIAVMGSYAKKYYDGNGSKF